MRKIVDFTDGENFMITSISEEMPTCQILCEQGLLPGVRGRVLLSDTWYIVLDLATHKVVLDRSLGARIFAKTDIA